ncbi:MAG: ABC transporter ATP-binding protein [Pirellulaceae bacterium]|nr:ABC transporter ATP-binding protein [Pirellulaceae bacterium]
MNSIVKIENVSHRFGNVLALDNLSLEIPAGCVFALLGENGAGKSTTIKSIIGDLRPMSGSVTVLGAPACPSTPELRRRIGYIPEVPALYDWMTVEEIGWFTAGFYPPGFTERYLTLTNDFSLAAKQKIKHLSKGGRAKVALALTLAHEPELLVLDEPTSGLDTLVRRRFLESMIDIASSGRTVLLSSHQIPEVERVADYVAIIHHGKLQICGSLEQLKAQHERWVVSFEQVPAAFPAVVGEIILHEGQGTRRQQLLIRNPGPDSLWQVRDHAGVAEVEVHVPSLEDLFVAYIKQENSMATANDRAVNQEVQS